MRTFEYRRFKKPNRWHSIQLRQYGDAKNRRGVRLASDGKHLSVRTHLCPFCGYIADRDVNAAQNILQIARPGHGLQALTYTDGCRVV